MHKIELDSRLYALGEPIDISIPLRFDGPQPNAFGVEPANSAACEYGSLVGDTRRGGSCNFERVTLIPHCNGTHTECVGHITDERIPVIECLEDVLLAAVLISVEPGRASDGDLLITREALDAGLSALGDKPTPERSAIVVRTLPNSREKLSQMYDAADATPYFTTDAMECIKHYKHLICDLPSIDRLNDEGKLLNHRIFWNVPPGSREAGLAARRHSTITELAFIPDEASDGLYLLNLQIAPFGSDAAPSRPVLFPIHSPTSQQ